MAEAKRDNNQVTTLLAVSNADGITPVVLWADPTTHRLLVSATSGSLDDLSDVVITGGAQGDILYHNGTNWVNLAAGTNGKFLKTQGTGANPMWDTPSAGAAGSDTQVQFNDGGSALGGDAGFTYNKTSNVGTIGGLLVSGLTASELVATDVSKNLQSLAVATYPSLTELSYVKGATSAIQTQLAGTAKLASANAFSVGGHTITVADTANVKGLVIYQNDVTNDPLALQVGPDADKLTASTIVQYNDSSGSNSDWSFRVAGTGYPVLNLGASAGTLGTPTVVANNRVAGAIVAHGYDGSFFQPLAQIQFIVDGTPGANDMPGRIVFATTADGFSSSTNRLILDNAGVLKPATNDGVPLGTGLLSYSDLFLANGAVINFNNGNSTITHSAGLLTSNVPLSLGTSNALTCGSIELGAASDTTITRVSAGVAAIEGKSIYMAGGTDVAVADGGTNLSTVAAGSILGANSADTIIAVTSAVGLKLLQNNAGTITWETVTGTGSPVLATSPSLVTPVLGTPTSGTLTNCTGLPVAGITPSTVTALGVGSIELGHASDTTIARSGAGAITVEGVAVLLSGGALGTPSSGTGTNITGIPAASILAGSFGAGAYVISTSLQVATLELGHATDTTLARVSAGVVSIEGVNILTTAGGTLTGNITLGEGADPATIGIVMDNTLSADERYSGITTPGTAGATLAFGDICYLDVTATEWLLADASVVGTGGDVPLGICVDASTDGNATSLLLIGTVRSAAFPASVALGAPLYLSETAGDITATAPTTTDSVMRRVGWAITAEPNTIYFNPSNDYVTHT